MAALVGMLGADRAVAAARADCMLLRRTQKQLEEVKTTLTELLGGTAMQKLQIGRLGFGTARQKTVLERWTNPKPLQLIWDRAAI
jgi:hypothetical protein